MPKLRSGEEWAKSLRQDIKTEIGLGFNVCGHKRSDGTLSGTCKLTHRTEDGRRSSVMLPSLREHVQKHTACRFDSPLWQAPSWTDVANGYLDLTQWGPPPWTELQWVTLRNVIELAEDS